MSGPLARNFIDLGTVQPEITLGKHPGKGVCLQFTAHAVKDEDKPHRWDDMLDDLLLQVKEWTNYHFHWSSSPLYREVKDTHLFFQGEGKGWLLIEFWCADHSKIRNFVTLLRGRFEFKVEDNL